MPLAALAREVAGGPRPVRAGMGWGLVAGLTCFGPLLLWMVPFGYVAYVLLVGLQSLFVGAWVALLAAWGERRGRALVAVAAWVGLEALRSVWPLGGFSWGSLALTQHEGGLLLPVARTLGGFGISLILAVVAVALEEAIRIAWRSWGAARESDVPADTIFRAIRTPLVTVLVVLALAVLLGGEPPAEDGARLDVGIVQAGDTRATSAAGVTRLDSDRIVRVAQLALEATEPFAEDPPDLVIWPENSLDRDVRTDDGQEIRGILDEALELVGPAPILAGEYEVGSEPRTLYNQMTVFTVDGIGDSYVKRRPVPFGEYVPGRALLSWFPPLQQIPNDTLPGAEAQVLDVAGARIGGVICFENAFPGLVRDQVRAGADVLVVSTNNSSFGETPMSEQHLAQSQLRAVEAGRWVVHAGLSGISGFVSPDGEILQRTELFQQAAPRMDVPLLSGLTLAMRIGQLLPLLCQLLTLLALGTLLLGRRRAKADDAPEGAPSEELEATS